MFQNLFSLIALYVLTTFSSLAQEIVYPGFERTSYEIVLLEHVLAYKENKKYQIKAFGADLPKGRSFMLLANNEGIDVMFGGSTLEREAKYHPIRFPLLRGLNGWRIPLVRKGNEALFSEVNTLTEFKSIVPGQFHTWSDTKVLESNDIYVEKGSNSEGLYYMLHKGRFDYFPRSILEVYWDLERHPDLDIALENNTLIQYPTAYYYYVRKSNMTLANDIKFGLELALKDGSFQRIFDRYYGKQIADMRNSKRRLIKLQNPYLSEETPLARKELWIDLSDRLNVIDK